MTPTWNPEGSHYHRKNPAIEIKRGVRQETCYLGGQHQISKKTENKKGNGDRVGKEGLLPVSKKGGEKEAAEIDSKRISGVEWRTLFQQAGCCNLTFTETYQRGSFR